jgi:hypothetical protein
VCERQRQREDCSQRETSAQIKEKRYKNEKGREWKGMMKVCMKEGEEKHLVYKK